MRLLLAWLPLAACATLLAGRVLRDLGDGAATGFLMGLAVGGCWAVVGVALLRRLDGPKGGG